MSDVELVNDDDGPPQFELEGPDDAPRVAAFDIRPALLDVAARENTDSFDDWRRDNEGGYMAELALYDLLMTHMNSRLVPVAIDELDTDAVDVFDEAMRAKRSYEAVDSQLKISCERSRKLVEKHDALVHEYATSRGIDIGDFDDFMSSRNSTNFGIASVAHLRRHLIDRGLAPYLS
ncbi:hypothetical protein PBRA_009477 [Plasmodiophora brassicae]|uniref:Uncharacterized protein n=1 Tax=Plasmodiophora brassicae TaxID=37360 RepID=A0A0G4J7S4_PLABS|nr:hypothetical protein PBRA_009477 [Plasmodiophora brassicae]